MNISNFIEDAMQIVEFPLSITENSKSKCIRVSGVLLFIVWFFPAFLIWTVIAGTLAIPAIIFET